MDRRSVIFGTLPGVFFGRTLTRKAEAGTITGIGLALDEWLDKFGEPDQYLEFSDLGTQVSVYDFGEFTVKHNIREGFSRGIIYQIEYEPKDPSGLYYLKEGYEKFLPTDSERTELVAVAGGGETVITYTSEALKETLASKYAFRTPWGNSCQLCSTRR